MKGTVIRVGALAGVIGALALAVWAQEPAQAPESAGIPWRKDLAAARAEANAAGKPLFVVFRCET